MPLTVNRPLFAFTAAIFTATAALSVSHGTTNNSFWGNTNSQDQSTLLELSQDVLAAALEEAVLDNIRLTNELEALRARDHSLSLAAFSGNRLDIQERALELLRQSADLKKENQRLAEAIKQLSDYLDRIGVSNIDIINTFANISDAENNFTASAAKVRINPNNSAVKIDIIAKDDKNGWFIANAGWDSGLIEGMIYSFDNNDGTKGNLRVIETRRHVSALIPQMGGSAAPTIGQKLTLETR